MGTERVRRWELSAVKMSTETEEEWKDGKMEKCALSSERVRRWELSTVKMSTVKMSTETKDRQKTEDGRWRKNGKIEKWKDGRVRLDPYPRNCSGEAYIFGEAYKKGKATKPIIKLPFLKFMVVLFRVSIF